MTSAALTDGGYCQAVQRRLSRPLSARLGRWLSPSWVTFADFAAGVLAVALVLTGAYIAAAVAIQAFGVLSCVDGEVARLRRQVSRMGDYFDTMVDRSVELGVLAAALLRGLAMGLPWLSSLGFALLGGVALLMLSSEKYRSVHHTSYPKRSLELPFLWITSGSDARMLVVSLLLVVAAVRPAALPLGLAALAAAVYANLAYRFVRIWLHLRGQAGAEA
jgi:phosphatidylglycerophosphate synthase